MPAKLDHIVPAVLSAKETAQILGLSVTVLREPVKAETIPGPPLLSTGEAVSTDAIRLYTDANGACSVQLYPSLTALLSRDHGLAYRIDFPDGSAIPDFRMPARNIDLGNYLVEQAA